MITKKHSKKKSGFSRTFLKSFNHGDLDDIGWKVKFHRGGTGIDDHVSFFQESPFFQDVDLIENDVVKAFFFGIIKGTNAPAQA